jgi:hypothetical protein
MPVDNDDLEVVESGFSYSQKEPAFDDAQVHLFADLVVEHLVAADCADGEVFGASISNRGIFVGQETYVQPTP